MNRIKIVCYGDSNTFGYIPGQGGRYDRSVRWPGVLGGLLGESCEIAEEGLCGRTTAFEDAAEPGRCGLDQIQKAVGRGNPLDLLIVMLGSNDCKAQFHASAEEITEGLEQIVRKAEDGTDKRFWVLLIAPAVLTEQILKSGFGSEFDRRSIEVSKKLAETYKELAKRCGCGFLDASKATAVSETDGLHLDAEGHRRLAEAVYERLKQWPEDIKAAERLKEEIRKGL